ncbi:unnamed protein product [Chondrus crispus]|uniref:Uncharacterized protein n=1 Tax=Chondrus crispus TaxID=2769 RepID=R7QE92_CHOCR|nr:unnamed protein product [Chondrus crispus]CDF35750.1 unnamed protein product [Chondrus crispus]|eukprot:XP_005715569.1 unnamed protein product [Chondrus crispus]
MSEQDISRHLDSAKSQVSELRSQVAIFQKEIKRKEKRLAKATSNSAKLETLLMQTESEAEVLRAKCAHTETAVLDAKRAEADLVSRLEATAARFDGERGHLVAKSDQLADALAQKLDLIARLESKVAEGQKQVEEREQEFARIQEEYRVREKEALRNLASQEDLVSSLQSKLEETNLAHEAAVVQVSEKYKLDQHLQSRTTEECNILRTKLEDANISIHNLQLRLKEVQLDNDLERSNLENDLQSTESEVAQLQSSLDEKSIQISSLKAGAAETQAVLENTKQTLLDSENKLESTQASLAKLHAELENINSTSDSEQVRLKTALTAKSEEVLEIEKLHTDEVSRLQNQIQELSHKSEGLQQQLLGAQEEKTAVLSRLEASQNAVQGLQRSLSESEASWNEQVHLLRVQMEQKESEVGEEKDAAMSSLQSALDHSQKSLEILKKDLKEHANHRVSLEQQLQDLQEEKETELELLRNSISKSRKEFTALEGSYKVVQAKLHEVESISARTISELRKQMDEASEQSEAATSECVAHRSRLSAIEQTCQEQHRQLESLQTDIAHHVTREAECQAKLEKFDEEKAAWTKKSLVYHETISKLEQEKVQVAECLGSIYKERDDITACVEELKLDAVASIQNAQDDASEHISDLHASNEALNEELDKLRAEGESKEKLIAVTREELDDSRLASRETQDRLNEILKMKDNFENTQQKLRDTELKLAEMRAQVGLSSKAREGEQIALKQEIELKDSNMKAKDTRLQQLNNNLKEMRTQMEDLGAENSKLRANLVQSDKLLSRAGDENQKFIRAFSQAQGEFSETLASASEALKKSQKSEEESRTVFQLLVERLFTLNINNGLTKVMPQSLPHSPTKLQSQINSHIVELEEHLQAERYLEAELATITKELDHQRKLNEVSSDNYRELDRVLNETKEELEQKRKEIKMTTSREKELQEQLHSLHNQLGIAEENGKTLQEEIASLKSIASTTNEGSVKKDEEIAELTRLEAESNNRAQQFRDLAEIADQKLAQQERAAEVALISVQGRQKELESEVEKSENDLAMMSAKLNDACLERKSMTVELQSLGQTHHALIVSYISEKLGWVEDRNKSQTEWEELERSRRALETSLLHSVNEIQALNADIDVRNQEVETQRGEIQEKLRSALQLEQAKAALEASLAEKEGFVQKYAGEVNDLKSIVSSLEAEKISLINGHVTEIREATATYEKKFSEASKAEDEKIRSLRSKLEVAEGELDAGRRESQQKQEKTEAELKEKNAEVVSIRKRFEAAKNAHELALIQKKDLEDELHRQQEVYDESNVTIEKLREDLSSKISLATRLKDKLGSADVSIAALEANVHSAQETIVKNSTESAATVDELLGKLTIQQTELNEAIKSRRQSESAAEHSQGQIERLQVLVEKVKNESDAAKEEARRLKTALSDGECNVAAAKEMYEAQTEEIKRTCAELSSKNEMVREELESRNLQLQEMRGKLHAAAAQLEIVTEDSSRMDSERASLKASIAKRNIDVQELRSALQEASNNLADKVQSLHKANTAISKLSEQIESTSRDKENTSAETVSSDALARKNIDLQQRSGKLAKRSENLQRSLKRLEKMLAGERRKNKAMKNEKMKRQVSPSTKGLSPAMKRSRDLERRQPFSPVAANARPPRDPKLSGKNLAF